MICDVAIQVTAMNHFSFLFFPIGVGGFLPGVKQIANVAALPGIVGVSSLSLIEVLGERNSIDRGMFV